MALNFGKDGIPFVLLVQLLFQSLAREYLRFTSLFYHFSVQFAQCKQLCTSFRFKPLTAFQIIFALLGCLAYLES